MSEPSVLNEIPLPLPEEPLVDHETVAAAKPTIMDRAVCLAVERGRFGNRRKAPIDAVMSIAVEEAGGEVDEDRPHAEKVDRTLLSASKRLLDSKELLAVVHLDSEISAFIRRLALPSMFKSGVYLVPNTMVEQVEENLRAFRSRRDSLVEQFIAAYPTHVRDIQDRLGDLFSSKDYPGVDTVRETFIFRWNYVTFGVPGTLKQIKASLFADEKAKYQTKLEEATNECKRALRAGLAEVVGKMVERLTDGEDGKRKIFKKSTVENLSEFMTTFDLRNIVDDAETATLVQKARDLMAGVDPASLRDDQSLRDRVRNGFASIAETLQTVDVDIRSRRIVLDDDSA